MPANRCPNNLTPPGTRWVEAAAGVIVVVAIGQTLYQKSLARFQYRQVAKLIAP
jgi:hypothetical protein